MPEPTIFITIEDIEPLADGWTEADRARGTMLLAGVLGWISRNAPCLSGPAPEPHLVDEAKMIVSEAILRAVGAKSNAVASESIGPSSVSYVDRTALPTLTRADEDALVELCPTARRRRQKFGTVRIRPGYLP